MTDRPILFSIPMVCALLDGSKTQTRRVLNPQPRTAPIRQVDGLWTDGVQIGDVKEINIRFAVGDRLYVREAWRTLHKVDCLPPRDLADDPTKITFEADQENRNPLWAFGKFRQGMHMPRWASRLTLTVTDVRVQRLQDINDDDSVAEGIERLQGGARVEYMTLWDSINAERNDGAYAWKADPWVVAVSFDVHMVNIDHMGDV